MPKKGLLTFAEAVHGHANATVAAEGLMAKGDKSALDTVVGRVNQEVKSTSRPTFNVVTAPEVIGAVWHS